MRSIYKGKERYKEGLTHAHSNTTTTFWSQYTDFFYFYLVCLKSKLFSMHQI